MYGAVSASIELMPYKSMGKRSAELGVPYWIVFENMKTDLAMRSFRPLSVNELSDSDIRQRQGAVLCCWNGYRQPYPARNFPLQRDVQFITTPSPFYRVLNLLTLKCCYLGQLDSSLHD
jgi:hypothetical protein